MITDSEKKPRERLRVTMKKPVTRTFYGWMKPRYDIHSDSLNFVRICFGLSQCSPSEKPCKVTVEYPVRNPKAK